MYDNLFVSHVKHPNVHLKLSFLIQTLLPLPVLHIPYLEDFPVQRTCARLLCSCVSFVRVDYTHTHALNKLPRASRNYEPNNPPCEDRESLAVCCDAECSLKFALRLLRSFRIISGFQFEKWAKSLWRPSYQGNGNNNDRYWLRDKFYWIF